jgi:hypothetical protein
MATLLDELSNIISALEDGGIEYAVCGGLALAIHGLARSTLDISFKERAVEIRRVSKIDDNGEVLSLDLLLVTPHVEDVWDTRETIGFLGNKLSVVSREGLIKMKTLAGRPQDLADIERLENEES